MCPVGTPRGQGMNECTYWAPTMLQVCGRQLALHTLCSLLTAAGGCVPPFNTENRNHVWVVGFFSRLVFLVISPQAFHNLPSQSSASLTTSASRGTSHILPVKRSSQWPCWEGLCCHQFSDRNAFSPSGFTYWPLLPCFLARWLFPWPVFSPGWCSSYFW